MGVMRLSSIEVSLHQRGQTGYNHELEIGLIALHVK